jgi:hypothetical protein
MPFNGKGAALATRPPLDISSNDIAGTFTTTLQVIFVLRLTPLPGVDGIKALRAALKTLLRRHGLRCISIKQDEGAK